MPFRKPSYWGKRLLRRKKFIDERGLVAGGIMDGFTTHRDSARMRIWFGRRPSSRQPTPQLKAIASHNHPERNGRNRAPESLEVRRHKFRSDRLRPFLSG